MLPKRDLGTTGMRVSCLGLGTVKFGRNRDVKYPEGFELPSDREITALLDLAREAGINLLDTAPAYGSSERRIGRLLPDRDNWLLGTKVGEIFEGGHSRFDFSAAHVRESIEQSLRHLRTDRLDLVLIHSDGNDLDILDKSDCLETLERMRREGLLRAVGMSSKTIEGGLRAIELVDVLMLTYNRSDTSQKPVIDQAQKAGKGVLIKKGLASGHAVHGKSDSVADNFRFLLEPPGISSVIVGTINPDHLRKNIEAVIATGPPPKPAPVATLDEVLAELDRSRSDR